jgi:hypothetical protein
MSISNSAGIYVIVDVNSPTMSLNRDAPWTSYYQGYLEYVFQNIENFMNYPNTLAFFSANEVINSDNTTQFNPQYIRVRVDYNNASNSLMLTYELGRYSRYASIHIPPRTT